QSPVASATILPAGDPAREGLEIINEQIGHTQLFPVQVVLTMDDGVSVEKMIDIVADATRFIEQKSGVTEVASVLSAGIDNAQLAAALTSTTLPEGLEKLWSDVDGHVVTRLVVETAEGPDSVQSHQLVTSIRNGLPD